MKKAVFTFCLFAVVLTATALNSMKAPAGTDPSGELKSIVNMSVAEQKSWRDYTTRQGKPVTYHPCAYCGCLSQNRATRKCNSYGCINKC